LCDQLNTILKGAIPGAPNLHLILWKNDLYPDARTVVADLVESTWGGYLPVTLTRSLWSSAVLDGDRAVSTWGLVPITWSATTGPAEVVYGYAMIDQTAGVIRYVQRFDAVDIRLVSPGGIFSLVPRVDLATNYAPEYRDSGSGGIAFGGSAVDVWVP
jgi:hypothetical protein